ncbi:uncharacterized protein LOC131618559 [Vicia villosa]|uniref:uncharacterized protein LOC131618559 n=1 Tax=Vicia villosa TaxID=3911 RepID=UPI00273C7547|nr:uncharacterized protein LOC131618559 [Vicia villosa]
MEDETHSTLRSAPSFEIYNKSHHHEDHDYNNNINDPEQVLRRTALSLETIGSDEFTFERGNMDLIEETENEVENDWSTEIQNLNIDDDEDVQPSTPPMYLATGLGVDGGEVAVSGNNDMLFVPSLQESEDLQEYYKKMVHEYPSHPLILKKYAHFLQGKGELQDAEEYFHRATEADPNDGEILMHYAKLVWENHHDRDRASVYFERAAQTSPQDSDVLAAYVSFLWETEDDENEDGDCQTQNDMEKQENVPVKTSKEENGVENLTTTNFNEDSNDADYLKLIDENPKNPLFLKKYAQFLFQTKKDLEAAEGYYSRAVSADPSNGETISEYAKLHWELHHDQEKALSLFEQAVQATPEDSNVLAAYTCFLWETEGGES